MNEAKNTTSPDAKIAIIGTEGAGKTVFVTVWSKLLEKQEEGKPFIVPDSSTYAYIEKNWNKLRNGQWPESTPQSEFVHLSWRLKTPSGSLCQINVCDVAGHDIRRLFTGNKPQVSDDPTKAIYDTVAAANIVLVIINLKDFITTTESQRIDNCANLLSMLQHMFDQKKKVALVFSQWHEYEVWVAEYGSVETVLSTYVSAIFNTCSLEGKIIYFKVGAVVETISNVEGTKTIRNPAPNFTSSGLSDLNDWILTGINKKIYTKSTKVKDSDDSGCVLFILGYFFVSGYLGFLFFGAKVDVVVSVIMGIFVPIGLFLFIIWLLPDKRKKFKKYSNEKK